MYSNGYKYRKKLTIDNTKLASGTLDYYQVLVNHTDVALKSVANGGKVRLNPLLDIRFEDTSGNKLAHEIVTYTATTGYIEAYVKLVSVNSASANEFYIYYGKDLSQVSYEGILYGIGSADTFNIKRNWLGTGPNPGEATPFAVNVKDVNGATLNVDSGIPITMAEDGTSHVGNTPSIASAIEGFIMYSATSTISRFSVPSGWNDKLISVFREGGQWWYDNNGNFGTFTPVSTDILVAQMRWNSNNTSDATRTTDYADVVYAGEELSSYAWSDDSPVTYDEFGFGATNHGYRMVSHMDKAINTSATWFEMPESTVFSNVGASSNMASGNLVAGKVGDAYDFDGTNDFIAIDTSTVIQSTGNQSTSMWVKWDTVAGNQCVMGRRWDTSDTASYMWFSLGGQFAVDLAGSASRWNTGWYPSAGVWYHIAVVIESVNCRLYVNGNLQASLGIGGTHGASANYTIFGASHAAGTYGNYFNGQIDEPRFSAKMLSAQWYKAEYNNTNSPSTFYTQSVEDVAVTANDTLHAHTADGDLLLIEHKLLAVADALHAHSADNLAIVEHKTLVTNDTIHSQTVDSITITQAHTLAVNDTLHSQIVDSLELDQGLAVISNYTTHAHTADNVVLTQRHILVVQDTLHAQTVDTVALLQNSQLDVHDATHTQTADGLTLLENYLLDVHSTRHTHSADSIANIVNWDDLSVKFGLYKPDYSKSGSLTEAEQNENKVLKPFYAPVESLEEAAAASQGIFKPKFAGTGQFK